MKRFLVVLLLAAGCGGGKSGPSADERPAHGASDATFRFTHSPLALADLTRIIALGNLHPPMHTIPTDHMYFFGWHYDFGPPPDPAKRYPVTAPAGGVVTAVFQPSDDYKIVVDCGSGFGYYLDHILPAAQVKPGVVLKAGEAIGTSSGPYAIDFGATRADVTLGFVNPKRYPEPTLRCVSPLAYYDEPLRSELLAKVWRVGPDKHGRIDYDQPGRLIGNWFLDGVPEENGDGPEPIAFVPDVYDPSIARISIGGPRSMTGAFATTGPPFETVTPASGKVAYRLYNRGGLGEVPSWDAPRGLLIVRMLDAETIRVETFAGALDDADFTPQSRVYRR